jgi:hypothetical protein
MDLQSKTNPIFYHVGLKYLTKIHEYIKKLNL